MRIETSQTTLFVNDQNGRTLIQNRARSVVPAENSFLLTTGRHFPHTRTHIRNEPHLICANANKGSTDKPLFSRAISFDESWLSKRKRSHNGFARKCFTTIVFFCCSFRAKANGKSRLGYREIKRSLLIHAAQIPITKHFVSCLLVSLCIARIL